MGLKVQYMACRLLVIVSNSIENERSLHQKIVEGQPMQCQFRMNYNERLGQAFILIDRTDIFSLIVIMMAKVSNGSFCLITTLILLP